MNHAIEKVAVVLDKGGIVARCICGWVSRPHFSSFAATVAFMDHEDGNGDTDEERLANDAKPRQIAAK